MPTYYHNEILFSEIYLEEITRQAENADVLASLKVLGEYREYADTDNLKAWKESYVHEVLSALGFFAQSGSDHLTYLFPMGSSGAANPLSLCYVVLPDESPDNTTIGRNWAEKIIRALRENNLQWGLLTNGKQWRIYHQDEPTPYETYLEIDLEAILKEKAKEAYQIFHKFMKAENFAVQEDGKCQFDRFKKESQDKIDYIEKELANALKQREEGGKGVLSDLCMGYVEELRRRNEGNVEDEALRKKIYHGAMLYMFRLLFLFYADARGLLSDENHELLAKVEGECRTRHDGNGSNAHNFLIWNSLEHIFVDIDQTYNGGLFSPQESEFTRFLSDTRISDAYLANVIFNLTTYKEKNGQEKPISYRDMSVRHLGTLYEGLLEHKLFIASEDTEVKVAKGKIQFIPASQGGKLIVGHYIKVGEVYFAGDPSERKSTGSYYTPEYIVDYIVRNTVGEKLKEMKGEFLEDQNPTLDAYMRAVDEEERKELSDLLEENALAFVREKVLKISVLDPAMGSGHFLVNASNLISNFLTETINEMNIQGTLESGTGYWRRWVVEDCIYGVDLNPLAVELAKLSIWILSMAKDQPLSFLNHHLKCGNSLVGAKLEEIGNYPFSTVKKELHQLHLFDRDPDFKSAVEAVILKSRQIAGKASSSLDDVREKKVWLEEIDQILKGYKAICDVHTSLYFGNKIEEVEYQRMVQKKDFILAGSSISNHHFQWELEFPEVFFDSNRKKRVFLGNPPWGSEFSENEKSYMMDKYEFVHMRTPESFNYFLALAYFLVGTDSEGVIGTIIPSNFLFQHEFAKSRKFFIENSKINKIINLGDSVFEATAPSCIVIFKTRGNISIPYFFVTDMRNTPRDELRHSLESPSFSQILEDEIISTPGFVIQMNQNDSFLLSKVLRNTKTTLTDIATDVSSGIGTGGDKIYRISETEARELRIEQDLLRPILIGREFHEYYVPSNTGNVIIYSTKNTRKDEYPNALRYLANYEDKLSQKRETVKGLIPWWSLHWPRNQELFSSPKIILRQTADTLIAAVDMNDYYCLNSVIIVRLKDDNLNYYLVGLLNSTLLRWIYKNLTQEQNRVFAEVKPVNLRKLPIHLINVNDQVETELFKKIISLVKDIEFLQNQRFSINKFNEEKLNDLQKELNYCVYKVYGLDNDEVDLIENADL